MMTVIWQILLTLKNFQCQVKIQRYYITYAFQCFRVKSFVQVYLIVSSLYLIIYKVKKKKVPGMKAPRSMIFSLLGRTPPSLSMSSGGVVVLPMIGKLWVDVDI